MQNQDNHSQNDQPTSSIDAVDDVVGNFKTLLFFIGCIVLILSILVLMPMFFTYLSEGDYRPPSEVHATDSVNKKNQSVYVVDK